MRSRGAARGADIADHLALADLGAHARPEAHLVRVTGRERAAVLDAGEVAVAARGAFALEQADLARQRGADRRARRDGDVDARVAVLPGARLAERRRERAVDGPDHPARAGLDRARG